jgi:DNA-binding beta-propeller fold protein YncE
MTFLRVVIPLYHFVLTISGKTVTAAGKVDLGNPNSLPRGKISVLSVDGSKVEDTKRVMTGGFAPYAIQISPKGDVAVVGNQGGLTGDIDTINVIDLTGRAPRVVHTLDVGQIVEGLAFSDDGNYVAVTAQDGSTRAPTHPFYNDNTLLVVFSVNGTNLTKVADAKTGKWGQGAVWSRDGKTLLVQSMVDNALSVLSFDGKNLKITGEIKVNGGPEGLRTSER